MGIELRMPNITAQSEREQLVQIRSYLYQFIPQLQWALNNMDTSVASSHVAPQTPRVSPSQSFDTEVAFSTLKPLIIKSADIVEAYYEEINRRLEGLYVAESDFGTFMEQTSQEIKQTSTYTDQQFSNVQAIITDKVDGLEVTFNNALGETDTRITTEAQNLASAIGTKIDEVNEQISKANDDINALKVAVVETDAYIRSGELYRVDEIPVYGLEIGQRNTVDGEEVFNKFARFTADRLSFFDQNGSEVAYISDYKLFIRNAEITSSLKIGGFVDTVSGNGDVVTKWVGWSGGEA